MIVDCSNVKEIRREVVGYHNSYYDDSFDSVTFSDIQGDRYDSFDFYANIYGNVTGAGYIALQLNGDTGSNYYYSVQGAGISSGSSYQIHSGGSSGEAYGLKTCRTAPGTGWQRFIVKGKLMHRQRDDLAHRYYQGIGYARNTWSNHMTTQLGSWWATTSTAELTSITVNFADMGSIFWGLIKIVGNVAMSDY